MTSTTSLLSYWKENKIRRTEAIYPCYDMEQPQYNRGPLHLEDHLQSVRLMAKSYNFSDS